MQNKVNSNQSILSVVYWVVFVTTNIILMPHLGAALTTIIVMLGQMLMGVIIDHFGLLGTRINKITTKNHWHHCDNDWYYLLRLFLNVS